MSSRRPQRGEGGWTTTAQQREEWAQIQPGSSCPSPVLALSNGEGHQHVPLPCAQLRALPLPSHAGKEKPSSLSTEPTAECPQEVRAPLCDRGRPRALPHRLDAPHPQPQLFSRPIAPDTALRTAQLVACGAEGLPIALGRRAKEGHLRQTEPAP